MIGITARINDYLQHHARATPAASAYRFEGKVCDYATLARQVDAFARALLASGVRAGQRIAMLGPPRPEVWISFLAACRIGATWIGLNPKYTLDELRHNFGDSHPDLLFSVRTWDGRDYTADCASLKAASADCREVVFLDALADFLQRDAGEAALQRAARTDPSDLVALIVYTSGSTGRPKGAMLTQRALASGFRIQADRMELARPVVLCNLPVNHIACIGDLSLVPLILGGCILFMERFDPGAIVDAVLTQGLDCLLQVPTMLQLVSQHPRFAQALPGLQRVMWGGAALPEAVIRAYLASPNPQLRLGAVYGMTELAGSISYTDTGAPIDVLMQTVGRPDAGIGFRIVDAAGRIVRAGEAGEIQVAGAGLMAGYFGRDEPGADWMTEDGYFRTGDVGHLRADGNLVLTGRIKEMYKSGGYNVYPREIEMRLEMHPAVLRAAVVGVPDPVWSEVGCAFVELRDGLRATPDELQDWCRSGLANYKVPKRIMLLDPLPVLAVGKVDKQKLKQLAEA